MGSGVSDIANAAACSINAQSELICDGKKMGGNPTFGYIDMTPIAVASSASSITDQWSIDENNGLHWKSAKFASLPNVGSIIMKSKAEGGQGGEALWGLMKFAFSPTPMVFAQLGCPGGTHSGLHAEVVVGSGKVVPL
jgi:hypothetical protein